MPDASPLEEPHRQVVSSMRVFANELELYVAAAGREHEMHRTDLAGLSVVMDHEELGDPVTPGRLSTALQLSAPATSAMLDRLERLGHVRRTPHATDRRSVVVQITDRALEVGGAMFGRLGEAYAPLLAEYDDAQLELVAEFLRRAARVTNEARGTLGEAR